MFALFRSQFASLGGQEVYPLWALSTVANGGLDWTTKQIGQVRFVLHAWYFTRYRSRAPFFLLSRVAVLCATLVTFSGVI